MNQSVSPPVSTTAAPPPAANSNRSGNIYEIAGQIDRRVSVLRAALLLRNLGTTAPRGVARHFLTLLREQAHAATLKVHEDGPNRYKQTRDATLAYARQILNGTARHPAAS